MPEPVRSSSAAHDAKPPGARPAAAPVPEPERGREPEREREAVRERPLGRLRTVPVLGEGTA